jgi:hypothetical protein
MQFLFFFSHHALKKLKLILQHIFDECDKYELPDITDTFSFNFSTADSWVRSRIVSGREGGGGSLKGSAPCFGYCLQVVGFLYSLENLCNMELLFYNGLKKIYTVQ